jgi:hypothetical protein
MKSVPILAALALAGFSRTYGAPITFNKDVAPILFEHCAICHRPGQSGPFPLLTYEDARKRARLIADVTARRYMPPWLPEPGCGEFAGKRGLSEGDIGVLRQWSSEGALEGQASDLPPRPQWPDGWVLGKPDLVLELPKSYTLSGEGKDVYRNFVVPVPLERQRYVKGIELQPANPKIVHHAFIKVDSGRNCRKLDGQDGTPGFPGMGLPDGVEMPEGHFLVWQPGRLPAFETEDMAWSLSQQSDLILQMHLRPSGKAEALACRIGLYFTDTPPSKTCFKLVLVNMLIDIPAGEKNYAVEDEFVLPVDSQVLGILPHAHYLCKRMEGVATLPDGTKKWLLLIKNWDFNWQGDYRYSIPPALPRGTKLSMRFTYDNSTNNVQNPNNPPRPVRYGPQSSDEMAELWFQLLPVRPQETRLLAEAYEAKMREAVIQNDEYRLRLDPNNVQVHTELGFIRFLEGKPDAGIEHLHKAIALDPKSDTPHYKLGLILRYQKRVAEAKAEFDLALKLNPRNYDAHGNLGVIFAEEGKLELAEQHLRAALAINPEDPITRELLGELMKAKGGESNHNQ